MGSTIEAIRQSTDRNKRRGEQRVAHKRLHDSTDKDVGKISEKITHICPHCEKPIEVIVDLFVTAEKGNFATSFKAHLKRASFY